MHDPICTEDGDLGAALYGSFLPIPPLDVFAAVEPSEFARDKAPGGYILRKEPIELCKGRDKIKLKVTNNGDRPIQVGRVRTHEMSTTHCVFDRSALITTSLR